MGVLALTNNMMAFTFFQSKITLSFALFQNASRNRLQRHWIRLEKCCIMVVIRLKKCRTVILYLF